MRDLERHEQELLQAAAQHETGDAFFDSLRLGSLMASASGQPHLQDVLQRRLAPEQAQLDLHLSGEQVKNHAANASFLGRFLTHLSDAAKEISKEFSGRSRAANTLLVQGFAPGSLEVTLQAPPAKRPEGQDSDGFLQSSTSDSKALRLIAMTMSDASEDSPESDSVLVADIPKAARGHLRLAASDVLTAGWEIDGTLVQRGMPPASVQFTRRGADRLVASLEGVEEKPVERRVYGTVDGSRVSLGRVYLIPDHGRALSISTIDDELIAQAGRLASEPGTRVLAVFEETRSFDASGNPLPVVSRRLTSLRPVTSGYEQLTTV